MPNDWLQHKQLSIIRGVYAAPGDTNSVEPAIVTLNLMSNNTGIALKADGWSPNIPSLKDSGVWADSPISDGRKLISGVNSNVVETMQLTITGATFKDVTAWLSALRNMMQDARDFWQANAQIDPVYLKWWASCGAGAQYALIYNMDMKPTYVQSPTPTLDVTLTIERETFWRVIPPGANPKQWTYEARTGVVYDYTKAQIGNQSDQLLVTPQIQARSEFTTSAAETLLSNNAIVIPAASIPGDAPALLEIEGNGTSTRTNFIMGKKTRNIRQYTINNIVQNTIFTAPDGTLGTDATLANDTGAVKAMGAANAQRVAISFATATNALRWRALNSSVSSINSINRFIGRWQVFLRCRQSAGTTGDITMYLRYGSQVLLDTDGVKMNVVSPPVTTGGTGNSTDWGLVYMGVVDIPFAVGKANVNSGYRTSSGGQGLDPAQQSFDFGLFALRSTGAGVLYLCDLILIPIDEGSICIEQADGTAGNGMLYDETGYGTHGLLDPYVSSGSYGDTQSAVSFYGTGIQLTPNVENRIYVIPYNSSKQSRATDFTTFTADIIPRWQGIRGV